jgi:membrane protease YdiL (CAAX protease family)
VLFWSALVFALIFPTAISWAEDLAPAEDGTHLPAIIYGGGKVVQFAFPLICLWLFGGRPRRPTSGRRGYGLAAGFGLVVAAGILGLYYGWLRDTVFFARAAGRIQDRLSAFGLNSPAGFALFAFLIAVIHSFLEEYYWRWFVFGWLEGAGSLGWAVALSSLGFMVPHYFALVVFLGNDWAAAIGIFTLCVGAGGVVWAWLFHRTGSLAAVWGSHFVVDAGLFVVGYDLFFSAGW